MPQTTLKSRGIEKRKHPRYKIQFRTHFSLKSPMVAGEGILEDVSLKGCRLTTETQLTPGAEVEMCIFTLEDPNPIVIDSATVQWGSSKVFGLAFKQLRLTAQRRLAQLCRGMAM